MDSPRTRSCTPRVWRGLGSGGRAVAGRRCRRRGCATPALPAGLGDQVGQGGLVGPGPDRLGEVDVGVRAASETARAIGGSALIRYSTYTVRNGAQVGWLNSQTTSRPPGRVTRQHLAQPGLGVDDVAQPEGDRDRVEGAVGERQPGPVAGGERQVRPVPPCRPGACRARSRTGTTVGARVGERLARGARCRPRGRAPARPAAAPTASMTSLRQRRSWPSESTSLVTS